MGEAAIIDSVWCYHSSVADHYVDVTIRSPMNAELVRTAAHVPGTAARAGDREKDRTYPPAGGVTVVPWAMESFGRVSERLEADLAEAAMLAQAEAASRVGRPAGSFAGGEVVSAT